VALVVGALTSAVSLLEVVVASSMDRFGWQRRKATLISGAAVTLLGVWSAFDLGVLDLADSIAINVFLLGGGLGIAIFVGWVMEDPVAVAAAGGEWSLWLEIWRFALRFVVPVVLGFILWHSLPQTWQKLGALVGF
jgi:NSS family neurotransmitter:Na+ symporter